MRLRTSFAALTAVMALAVGLSACVPADTDRIVPGSALTVAQPAPVTSLNPSVLGQDSAANAALADLTTSGFWGRDASGERVRQERFGSIRVQSRDPLTVTYTVNSDVQWSDGARVDAADLLLAWAAGTTHRTGGDGDAATRWDTGAGPDRGLDLVTDVPEIGDDGRSVTLVYASPFADWESAFDAPPVAAHTVAMLGHPGEYENADAAKAALIAAVQADDLEWLAPVSRAFREDFALDGAAWRTAVTSGAYLVEDVDPDGTRVELRANPDYVGGPSPRVAHVTVRAIPDAAERLRAVTSGEADIAAASATAQLTELAGDADGASVAVGAAFDHIDLQTAGGGVFDPATYGGDEARAHAVRAAFLATIPRAEIVAELVSPFVPDAATRRSSVRPPAPVGDPHPLPTSTGTSTGTPIPPLSDESTNDAGTAPDIAHAKELLAQANMADATVRLLFPTGDERRAAAFARIAESAARAGISVVDASRDDWATALWAAPSDYDAALFSWDADPSAPTALAAGFTTVGATNVYGWSDETVDGLVAQASAETDADARDALLDATDDAVTERAWTLALAPVPVLTVWSDAVAGAPPAVTAGGVPSGFAEWVPTGPRETGSESLRN